MKQTNTSIFHYDRKRYENILEDKNSALWKWGNRLIVWFVFLSLWLLWIETLPHLYSQYFSYFFFLNILISFVFLLEYTYRFMRSKNKKWFVSNMYNIADLLSFLPFLIEVLFSLIWGFTVAHNYFKALRLLRVLRLFDLIKEAPILHHFFHSLKKYKYEYRALFILMLIVLIIVTFFVYHFENGVNVQFKSIPDTLWWAIVTMMTVWYGDMYPTTFFWKTFWVILMIFWPVIVSILSSITILVFMDVAETQKKSKNFHMLGKICLRCNVENIDTAKFCHGCWKKLSQKISKNLHH